MPQSEFDETVRKRLEARPAWWPSALADAAHSAG